MFRHKLFWRFFLSIMAVVVLTSVCSLLVEYAIRSQRITHAVKQNITQLATALPIIRRDLQNDDLFSVRTYYRQHPFLFRQMRVIDSDGKLLLPFLQRPHMPPHMGMLPPPPAEPRPSFAITDDNLLVQETIKSASGAIYIITLSPHLSLHDINQTTQVGKWISLIILFIGSALICGLLTRFLLRKIRALQKAVRQIAQGNYASVAQLRTLGNDEFADLGADVANMADEIAENQRSRKQMLSDISHELRSPLARMTVALALARDKAPAASTSIDRIEKEAQRMNTLISQIIHIQQAGLKADAQQQRLNLAPILERIKADANFEGQASARHVTLSCPPELNVLAAPESIASALENIVRNALHHTPENSLVEITAACQEKKLIIAVSDAGAGVPEADLARIFMPFVRLDASRNRKTGGYGLGLAIAHSVIVDALGGTLKAYNRKPPQQGLCVEIHLPRAT